MYELSEVRGSKSGSTTVGQEWHERLADLREVDVHFEGDSGILWQFMKPEGRPCFTRGLLQEGLTIMDEIEQAYRDQLTPPVRYLVLASAVEGTFNLGGDLALFHKLIADRDETRLRDYAYACIEVQYRRATRLGLPICTIALVQGDALGGGFEGALANDVIIAERSAKFGLPEILFNLFPGMGAYSFLARRLPISRVESLMSSGRLYSADELHEMGVVDAVTDDGTGVEAVRDYIARHSRAFKARAAIAGARDIVQPVSRKELIDVTELWVRTALSLDAADLRKMELLVKAQLRRSAIANTPATPGAEARPMTAAAQC